MVMQLLFHPYQVCPTRILTNIVNSVVRISIVVLNVKVVIVQLTKIAIVMGLTDFDNMISHYRREVVETSIHILFSHSINMESLVPDHCHFVISTILVATLLSNAINNSYAYTISNIANYLSVLFVIELSNDNQYLDSGASAHMTGNWVVFQIQNSFTILQKFQQVTANYYQSSILANPLYIITPVQQFYLLSIMFQIQLEILSPFINYVMIMIALLVLMVCHFV